MVSSRRAPSCHRAFDNSIMPTRSDRSIPASCGLPPISSADPFFSAAHRSAKLFGGPGGAIVPPRSRLGTLRERGSRAPRAGVTISNSFSPRRPVDFTHRRRKWDARLESDSRSLSFFPSFQSSHSTRELVRFSRQRENAPRN